MSRYPEQFRRKVLDLLAEGRPVKHIAEDLDLSMQTLYNWRNQEAIDRSERPGSAKSSRVSSLRRSGVSVNSRTRSRF